MRMSCAAPLSFVLALLSFAASAAAPPPDPATAATLARIRDAAMGSDWAYQRLADLTDKIGPRLSGSAGAEAAVAQVAAALKDAGLSVTLQAVKAPHWLRGEERAELVAYAGRPDGITQRIHLTALGGSTATPAKGLTLPLLVVHSFAELDAHAAEAKGKIVLIDIPFDQALADNGRSGTAYGQAGEPRFRGPAVLAKLGAAAALVRSVGGANFRIAHTGATIFEDGGAKLPAAAVTVEDALLIERLAAQGPVTMKLVLTPQTLPDIDSHNVLADLPGREHPEEIVVVSGHLDSWDLGTGAIDDGAGVASAMGAVALLKSLGLQARRTIRVVAWMNEENGVRGGKAYFDANKNQLATQFAAIESDSGAGRPLGLLANVTPETMALLAPVQEALRPLGATVFERRDDAVGTDISPLQKAGVPGFEPLLDTRSYFSYHHTPADTLDKVDSDDLRRQVAVMAALAYYLADLPGPLARLPVVSP